MWWLIGLYVVPCIVMLVYDYIGIRWHLKRGHFVRPLIWQMVLRTFCPVINLWLAACLVMLDLDDFLWRVWQKR